MADTAGLPRARYPNAANIEDRATVKNLGAASQNWCLYLTEMCDFDRSVLSNLTYKWERGDGGGLSNWWLYLTEK